MSPHKSSSRTAISDATIKPLAIQKAYYVKKTTTPKISDDAKYLKISRSVLQHGLDENRPAPNASFAELNMHSRCLVAYLSGILRDKEPELSAQFAAVLGLTDDKLV